MSLPAHIFRAYDIRGKAYNELTIDGLFDIGCALARRALAAGQTDVCVARDGRLSSPIFADALIQGLLESGVNVIDLGAEATPLLYFATQVLSTQSGVMITASHNPAEYNGVKMVIAGKRLALEAVTEIYHDLATAKATVPAGSYQTYDILPEYIAAIAKRCQLNRKLKVVIDCANGIAAKFAPELFSHLGCEVIPLFAEVDGRFPNHPPDPSVAAHLTALQAEVLRHHADIGLAFDGDADRLGVVTASGKVVPADRLMMLFASDLLAKQPNASIVFDIKCSRHLPRLIEQLGGQAIMSRTGHALIRKKMRTTGALMAGELSGHLFFADDWYGFDDAIYSAARLLAILTKNVSSLDELLAGFTNSFTSDEISIPLADDEKFAVMKKVIQFAKDDFAGAEIVTLDGLRIEYSDSWGLIRASNTSPQLIVRYEADSKEAYATIKQQIQQSLSRFGLTKLPD